MTLVRRTLLALAPLLAACHDERPDTHVYSAPAPRQAARGTGAAASVELPLGAMGPGAQITSVLNAATGIPVSLVATAGIVDVMAVVALGPDPLRFGDVRADLAISGPRDTILDLELGSPPPSMIAHPFRISVDALGPGSYSMRARLKRVSGAVVVESAPVFFTVPRR